MVQQKKKKLTLIIVNYKGKVYDSIAEASRKTNTSESNVRRLLRDPNNNDWTYVDAPDGPLDSSLLVNIEKAKKVRVGDTVYRSVRYAATKTNLSRRQLLRYIESKEPEFEKYSFVEE